ncbi:hypothetical protein EJB05_29595, partial [Eragrostis curvula]
MARVRGDSDPELAARLLARSPTSANPSRSQQQQQPQPRAPPTARRQPPPPTIAEGPGKQPAERISAPSQRTAPPPPRRAAALHPASGGAPLMPDAPAPPRRVHAPSPLQQQDAVASAAAALQPRQGMRVETVVARAQPPPPPTIAEGPGKQPVETTSAPSRRTVPPPPRRAATLHPAAPGGAPQMPNAPAPRRRVHAPSPSQQQEAVASAAAALQPRQGTRRVETVVARAQQPTPCTEEGEHAAAEKGEKPHHNSKQHPHRISNQCVPNSVKPSLQLRQGTRVEMVMTRVQQPTPCTGEGEHAAAAKWGEPHLCSKQQRGIPSSEGDKENHREECLNRVSKSPVPNTSQSVEGCSISNPTFHEIFDSIAAFATNKSDELDVIQDAIMVLPKGPRSMLYSDQSSDGGDCGGVGTSTSAVIHSHARGTAGITKPVVTFDVGLELARFGSVTSDPWKAIWEQQPLILHDADIVRAAKGIGCQVDVLKTITSVLQHHPGPVRYFRVDTCQIINGRDQLEEWCDLLKKKQVEEVVIVNSRWPKDILDFPINDLNCESLRQLRLCFFRVSDIVIPYVENLTAIDLCCCTISTLDLYALVDQCKRLKELDIGYYEGDVIRIDSKSLEILLVWQSTVKIISVNSALKLRRVLLAARPKKTDVGIWIDGARVLTDVWLNLSTQSITINNISFNKENSTLPSLKRLVLNLSLLVQRERKTMLNILKSCTTLQELTLWVGITLRNDTKSDDEFLHAFSDDWPSEFKNLSCLKLHLEVLNMKDFRGGESEIAIACAVLEHACCLKELNLEAEVNCSDDAVFHDAKLNLQVIVQASPSALVNYVMGGSDADSGLLSHDQYSEYVSQEQGSLCRFVSTRQDVSRDSPASPTPTPPLSPLPDPPALASFEWDAPALPCAEAEHRLFDFAAASYAQKAQRRFSESQPCVPCPRDGLRGFELGILS